MKNYRVRKPSLSTSFAAKKFYWERQPGDTLSYAGRYYFSDHRKSIEIACEPNLETKPYVWYNFTQRPYSKVKLL